MDVIFIIEQTGGKTPSAACVQGGHKMNGVVTRLYGDSVFIKSIMLAAAVLAFGAPAREKQLITASIVVQAGDTLYIREGSELLFAPFTGVTVKRGGRLSALGTKKQPIIFTAMNNTSGAAAPSDWNGIEIDSGGTAEFAYCKIANATSGVTAADSGAAALTQCIFSNNWQWDLSVDGVIQIAPNDTWPHDYPQQPPEIVIPPPELAVPPSDVTAAPSVLPKVKPSPKRQLLGWTMGGAGAAAAVAGVAFLLQAINHSAEYDAEAALNTNVTEKKYEQQNEPLIPGNTAEPDNRTLAGEQVVYLTASGKSISSQDMTQYFDNLKKKRDTATAIGLSFIGFAAASGILLTIIF